MPLIPFRSVAACSSEDRIHRAENLLKPEQYKKWLSSSGNDGQITCILELEKASIISSVDIGNDGSAFIELLVSNSSSTKSEDWTVLLPATLLMTPSEAGSNTNRNHVKLLKSIDFNPKCLNEKWNRIKIICEQKFHRLNQFGLCFIKIYSPPSLSDETVSSNKSLTSNKKYLDDDDDDDDETEKEQNKIGSFFARKQAEKTSKIIGSSPKAEIRALSNVADQLLRRKPMNDEEIQLLLKKTADEEFSTATTNLKSFPKSDQRPSKRRLSDEPSSSDSSDVRKRKSIDKSSLLKKVVFVLSGFQNPLRSELRRKATAMGATYSDDWDGKCTHLICAFANTPKFAQVQKTDKGIIVNKQWILDCHEQNKFLPENDYQLNETNKSETPNRKSTRTVQYDDDDESDDKHKINSQLTSSKKLIETFDDESLSPITTRTSSRIKTKITTFDDDDSLSANEITTNNMDPDIYDAETDEDEPNDKRKIFKLDNFFSGKHFYVFNHDYDEATFHDIRRIIYAYDGVLEKQLTDNVQYVITNRPWDENFHQISKTHPELKFLTRDWLQNCHDENKFVPYQSSLIVP